MIPIVVAFTPNYFVPAVVTISSILKNWDSSEAINLIVLSTGELPQRQKDKLAEFCGNKVQISYKDLSGRLSGLYVDERYTEAASYRLLLPDLLEEYDKAIYIDCDIVVRNDLSRLYNSIDLSNYYLAGVYEAVLDFQVQRMESIGCDPERYINSGFLVLNLEQLRKDRMTKKLLEALKVDYLEFPDQDVLNIVCESRIQGLPPYYNSIRTFYLPQYKETFLKKYTKDEWDIVQKRGNVHYTGGKPWRMFTVEFLIWWREYDELPEYIKIEWKEDFKMRLIYNIYKTSIGYSAIEFLRKLYRRCL